MKTNIQTSPGLGVQAHSLRRLAPALLLTLLGACQYYDFGDLLPGRGGHHGGHTGGGTGGSASSTDCGGLLGLDCPEGQFCSFAPEAQCGAADQTGTCAPRPDACTLQYDPVCGCDGQTYGNACGAASAGVSVASDGECAPAGQVCGTRGVGPCPDGEYCDFPAESECGRADRPGVCREQPGACTREYRPVCGCDGETYGNACTAAAAGVSVEFDGECGGQKVLGEGETCGGFTPPNSPQCAPGLFCQHQAGALCGAADAPGECVLVPDVCLAVVDPVCGCDGRTYGNACEAARAQVGILDLGACE